MIGADTPSVVISTGQTAGDLDFLAARLHARRSRMAETKRLDDLCRIRTLPEFLNTVFPDSEINGVLDFQCLLVHELIGELSGFCTNMSAPGSDLFDWMLVRFQVENLKVLIRACLAKTPVKEFDRYLISLPVGLSLDTQGLVAAESLEGFVRLVPKGLLRENLERALEIYSDYLRPFFFEAALDRGYFQGLLARMEKLSQEDREIIKPMFCQEVDIFHFMLITRGKFHYNLTSDLLLPLHVSGTRIPSALFTAALNDPDIYTSVIRIAQRMFDIVPFEQRLNDGSMPVVLSLLEGLAWKRFLCLANIAFRKSHMGLGTIMAYVGLRRVEIANLITISEGIRNGITAETIRGRLIPRTIFAEGTHV
jgi:V/A-type H+/Na+-transporting ATPase subunit C